MAMQSYILAMGGLVDAVVKALEKPPKYYRDAAEGTMVFAKLFQCNSTTMSENMAAAFGVLPNTPSTYEIDPWKVKRRKLDDAMREMEFTLVEDWLSFKLLRSEGFLFFFRPET